MMISENITINPYSEGKCQYMLAELLVFCAAMMFINTHCVVCTCFIGPLFEAFLKQTFKYFSENRHKLFYIIPVVVRFEASIKAMVQIINEEILNWHIGHLPCIRVKCLIEIECGGVWIAVECAVLLHGWLITDLLERVMIAYQPAGRSEEWICDRIMCIKEIEPCCERWIGGKYLSPVE